jgi:FAD/FMN-containing dehydrogenase
VLSEGLTPGQLEDLRRAVNCLVLSGSDAGYNEARRIWNGMIDRKPSAIVRPTGISDVMQVVRFARAHGLAASVRGGGHSVAGKSVADDVIMIDLSLMREVQVHPARRTALAMGGAVWRDFDAKAQEYRLATTGGVISSTGVCGLSLGGGVGWLMGKHGLSCDNILSADLVNADGNHIHASAEENEDLFWGLRGGGGNFGIVTALESRLHDLDSVHGGVLLYPRASAFDLLRQYRDITMTAPDELTAYAALLVGHGNPMAAIALCHSGSESEASTSCPRFCLSSPPVADMTGKKKYTELQSMLDFTAPAGNRYYFRCPFLRELTNDAIRVIIDRSERMPTEQSQVVLEHMHGAASRVPASQTAFGLRRVHYSVNVMPAWIDPAIAEKCIDWAREFAAALTGLGASDAYVNYLGEEGLSAVKASYGTNYDRLAALKKKYDPDNFFRFNQNILPAD